MEEKKVKGTKINQITKLASNLYMITETESVHCYLILGTQQAALIDVGYGYENITPLIRQITDLPVAIYLTHGDPDHGLGSAHYPKVNLHPLDLGKLISYNTKEMKQKSVDYRLKKMPQIKTDLNVTDFINQNFDYTKFGFVYDGDLIDLGDRQLQVIHTPGHSYGHLCFFDEKEGNLYSGDILLHHNIWYFMTADMQASFFDALSSYQKLKKLMPRIKKVYPAHGPTPIDPEIINENIACLTQDLPNNYQEDKPFNSFAGNGYQHFYQHVDLIYSDERLAQFLRKEIKRK